MARVFTLEPKEYTSKAINHYRKIWENVPHEKVIDVIATQNQMLDFMLYLLNGLRHADQKTKEPIQVGLSLRAGLIQQIIFLVASISEAAIRSHAEKRKCTGLNKNEKSRMFGNVLKAWKKTHSNGDHELAGIWQQLETLRDLRNNIHLHASLDQNITFKKVLTYEAKEMPIHYENLKVLIAIKSK